MYSVVSPHAILARYRIAHRFAHRINYVRVSLQSELMRRKWQFTHCGIVNMTDIISKAFLMVSTGVDLSIIPHIVCIAFSNSRMLLKHYTGSALVRRDCKTSGRRY